MLTAENVEQIMKDEKKSRFVYFYRGDENEIGPVAAFAQKMAKGMGTDAIILDCDQKDGADRTAVIDYLKRRNPKTADKVEKQFEENQFLLMNKYDDIWFWQRELMANLYGTIADQIFSFLRGPMILTAEEWLLINQSGDNDLHIITYCEDLKDQKAIDALKDFRKFNTKNQNNIFHYKFWMLEDKELANKLKIDTERQGDVYLVREAETPFNKQGGDVDISGYSFSSEKFLTAEQMRDNLEESYANLAKLALNAPVVIHDQRTFYEMCSMFKTDTLIIYCNPQVHGQATYEKVIKSVLEAREKQPLNFEKPEEGKENSDPQIIFTVSTT